MARRAVIGSSGLSPFGAGAISFSSFNLTSASQKYYLAFAKVEAAYAAGKATSDEYLAALEKYAGSLKPSDSSYYSAQTRVAEARYSIARDRLAEAITKGDKTWSDMVAFDRQALADVSAQPDSDVYRNREQALWASQTNEFRTSEKDIAQGLQRGTTTYTQALAWYQQQSQSYTDNPDLMSEISDRIDQARQGLKNERDQKEVDDWKAGKIDLGAFISYAQNAMAEDPNSDRSKTWQDNLDNAKLDAVQKSLAYRYGLTEEYRQLALQVASLKSPTGGASTSTRTVLGADGKWHTVSSTSYSGPSPAERAAYQQALLSANQAKQRMAQIVAMVGSLPGGWVTEDDMIATLAQQQASLVRGTPEWLQLQGQIDDYRGRKAADELLTQQGVRISLPGVGTERAVSPYVGSAERPVTAGAGGASVPRASGGGGGGSGGSAGGGGATAATSAAVGPTGPFYRITGVNGPGSYKTTATGLPAGMDSGRYDRFYAGFVDAIKKGQDTYTDPFTGVSYYLPPDPNARLKMLNTLDSANIGLKQAILNDRIATGKDADTAQAALWKAQGDHIENVAFVYDTPTPGVPMVTPTTGYTSNRGGDANPIAAGIELMDSTEQQVKYLASMAQRAFDNGDYTRALGFIRQATALVSDPSKGGVTELVQRLAGYGAVGQALTQEARTYGGEVTGQPAKDIERLNDLESWAADLWKSSGIEELSSYYTPPGQSGGQTQAFFAFDSQGNPVLRGGEIALAPDTKLVYDQKTGTIKMAKQPFGGFTSDLGSVNWSQAGGKTVTVQLELGDRLVPVEVPYTITTVGNIGAGTTQPATIQAKTVDVIIGGKHMVMAENPFRPGQWVPIVDSAGKATPLRFTLPAGVTIVARPDVRIGDVNAPQFAFTTGGATSLRGGGTTGGTQYVLGLDPATGTYKLWQFVNGAPELVSNLDPLHQGAAGLAILSQVGLGLDRNALTGDQRTIIDAGINAAFFGSTADLLRWRQQSTPAPWDTNVAPNPGGITNPANRDMDYKGIGTSPYSQVPPWNTNVAPNPGGIANPANRDMDKNLGWQGLTWQSQQQMAAVLLGRPAPAFTPPWDTTIAPNPGGITNPANRDMDKYLAPLAPPPVTPVLTREQTLARVGETPSVGTTAPGMALPTGGVAPAPTPAPAPAPKPKPTPIVKPPVQNIVVGGKTQTQVARDRSLRD